MKPTGRIIFISDDFNLQYPDGSENEIETGTAMHLIMRYGRSVWDIGSDNEAFLFIELGESEDRHTGDLVCAEVAKHYRRPLQRAYKDKHLRVKDIHAWINDLGLSAFFCDLLDKPFAMAEFMAYYLCDQALAEEIESGMPTTLGSDRFAAFVAGYLCGA